MEVNMSPEMIGLIGATLTGILSLLGVVITNKASNQEMIAKIETSQAVTDTKLQNVTDEVKSIAITNSKFAERVPVIENRVDTLENTVKEIKNEISK